MLSLKMENIQIHSEEFQKVSLLLQKCRFFNNEGSETFLREFDKVVNSQFFLNFSLQNLNSETQSEPYFWKFKIPFKKLDSSEKPSLTIWNLHYNTQIFDDDHFPIEFLVFNVLPQFKAVQISTTKHSSVVERLQLLRTDKHSEENQQKALNCFLLAVQSGDIEGCYFFGAFSILTIMNTGSNKIPDLSVQFLYQAIQHGSIDSLFFICLVQFPHQFTFDVIEAMGCIFASFWRFIFCDSEAFYYDIDEVLACKRNSPNFK